MMDFDWKAWFMDVWNENRRLTNNVIRRVANAEALDKHVVDNMRPFREMVLEIYSIERAYLRGAALEQWEYEELPEGLKTAPVEELLAYGKRLREETLDLWPKVTFDSLVKMRKEPFWGGPDGNVMGWLTYALENEIHHRGQGYVYLRVLGKQPPEFYVREETATE